MQSAAAGWIDLEAALHFQCHDVSDGGRVHRIVTTSASLARSSPPSTTPPAFRKECIKGAGVACVWAASRGA